MSDTKLQWSQFQGKDKNEQIVIRCDDPEEFDAFIEMYKVKQVTATPYQAEPVTDQNEGTKCNKCGANRVLNPKTGKYFCEKKCWLNPQEVHPKDLESREYGQ